jgi:membrane protein DedA with SNARE-associated domain
MGNQTKRNVVRLIAIPIVFLFVFASLYFVWELLDLPTEEVLLGIARNYFERYGLITVFIGAFVEGLLLIGWYFPGAIVILAALLLAGNNPWAAAQVLMATMAGLSIAYVVNFLLGKYGWYRLLVAFGLREGLERAKARLTKYGLSAIFTTYWQMNLASLTSTAAGILHFPAAKFAIISVVACVAWITFWGSMIFFLGQAATALVSLRVIIAVIAAWIVGRVIYARLRRRPDVEPHSG